jgi:hypothetical protein
MQHKEGALGGHTAGSYLSSSPAREYGGCIAVLSLDGLIPDITTAAAAAAVSPPPPLQQQRKQWSPPARATLHDSILAGTAMSPGMGTSHSVHHMQQQEPQQQWLSPHTGCQVSPGGSPARRRWQVPAPAAATAASPVCSPGPSGPLSAGLLQRANSTPTEATLAAGAGSTGAGDTPECRQQPQQQVPPAAAGTPGTPGSSGRPPYLQQLEGTGNVVQQQQQMGLASPLSTNRHRLQHLQAQQQQQPCVMGVVASGGSDGGGTSGSTGNEGTGRQSVGSSNGRAVSASPSFTQHEHQLAAVASAPNVHTAGAGTAPAAVGGAGVGSQSPGDGRGVVRGTGGAARMGRLRHRRARSDMPEYYPLSPLDSPLHTAMPADDGLDAYSLSNMYCLPGVASAAVLPLEGEGSTCSILRGAAEHSQQQLSQQSSAAAAAGEGSVVAVCSSSSLAQVGMTAPGCAPLGGQSSRAALELPMCATPLGSPLRTGLTSPAAQYRLQQQQQLRAVQQGSPGALRMEDSSSSGLVGVTSRDDVGRVVALTGSQQQQQQHGQAVSPQQRQQQQQKGVVVPRLQLGALQQRSSIAEAVAHAVAVYDGSMSPRRLARIQEFVSGLVSAGGPDSSRHSNRPGAHAGIQQQQQAVWGVTSGGTDGDGGAELTFRDAAFLGVSGGDLDISCLQQLLRLQGKARTSSVQHTDAPQQQQYYDSMDSQSLSVVDLLPDLSQHILGDSDTYVGEVDAYGRPVMMSAGGRGSLVQQQAAGCDGAGAKSSRLQQQQLHMAGLGGVSAESSGLLQEPSECSSVGARLDSRQQRQQQQRCHPGVGGSSRGWPECSRAANSSQDSAQVAVMQSQGALRAPCAAAAAAAAAGGSRGQGLASSVDRRGSVGDGVQGSGGQGFVGQQAGHMPETFKLLQLAGLAALGLGLGSVGSVDSTAASGAAGAALCHSGGGGVSSSLVSGGGTGALRASGTVGSSRLQLSQQLLASVEEVLRSLDIGGSQVGGGLGKSRAMTDLSDSCRLMSVL